MPIQATTTLPDAQPPTLGNGVEDEIAVDIPDDTNNGEYRVQTRETGASSWTTSAPGWDEQVLPSDSDTSGLVSTIVSGREDGEEYEVRVRSETSDATGAWTSPVSIVTQFPGATGLALTVQGTSEITGSFTDNSDNEDGFEIEVREELDPARPTGYGSWTVDQTLAPNTTSFSLTGLQSNHSYQVRVRAFTEDAEATSPTATATTTVSYPSGWLLELRRADGDILTIDGGDLITESIRYRRKPSAISSWNVDLPRSPVLGDWLDSEAYWWYNGSLVLRGPWHRDEGYESLSGKGWLWGLKQGGTSRRFQTIEGWRAARDYINEETPFTAVATQPSTNIIDEDKLVQSPDTASEWASTLPDLSTLPFLTGNGSPQVAQSNFVLEGEDRDRESASSFQTASDYSSGQAFRLDASSGDYVEWDFTPQYTIPAEAVDVRIRDRIDAETHAEWTLNGDVLDTIAGAIGKTLSWSDLGGYYSGSTDGYTGGDLQAGTTYTLRCEQTGATAAYNIDVVSIADSRFNYTYDNSVDANGYLSGPETKPDATDLELAVVDETRNITNASLSVTMSDTTGGQALAVSNDGGSTYPITGSNTTSISGGFPNPGSLARARVTLSRYGSRTTQTPTTGYLGQSIDSLELRVTTNSLGIIDDRTYTGNHFENLQSICDDAGVVFVASMQDGVDEIEVFALGDKSSTLDVGDDDVLDHSRVVDRESYANVQTVAGEDSDGSLITATAESETEISTHGRVEGPYVVEKRLSSMADVENQATQLLAQRIASREVSGWMDLVPEYAAQVTPGYEYVVSYGDFQGQTYGSEDYGVGGYGEGGERVILRSLDYSDLRKASLDFEDSRDVAAVLAGLGGELKQTKDAI